ncbi:reverse transcriptase domain-containing protein [Streptomyces sp. NPDC006335]|uniref:reverse transcriptase domain-containing protein n=1 Tax=Streptomyces sp. NPDC006335 TaxID=3156895 RepID=UPI0033A7820D
MTNDLNISKAVSKTLATPLDRLPSLITDRSLENSHEIVAGLAELASDPQAHIPVETITMPKKKFGQRPIVIPDISARSLFVALVDSITKDLEPDSRADGKWEAYEDFAKQSPSQYIVDIDIAACYEFIDHDILHRELLIRTMNAKKAEAIRSFLERCSFNNRGLPQLSWPSDRLADLYLSILERRLMRNKLEVLRYADDFRVRVDSWEAATEVIEYAAEYARDLGLILSSDKTGIFRVDRYKLRLDKERELQQKYLDHAKAKLTLVQLVGGDYDVEFVEIPPAEEEALIASMHRIVDDWHRRTKLGSPDTEHHDEIALRKMIPYALTALQKDRRIEAQVFTDLIYRDPLRLERVCKYVLSRMDGFDEVTENWSLLRSIVQAGKIGPWARIWLLHVAGKLPACETDDAKWILDWAQAQCKDRHEIVRAEAAWVSAKFGLLTDEMAMFLLKEATAITEHGIAASMGCQGTLNGSVVNSVISGRPMNRGAYEWGRQN